MGWFVTKEMGPTQLRQGLASKDCIYLGQQSMEIACLILAPAGGISRPGSEGALVRVGLMFFCLKKMEDP